MLTEHGAGRRLMVGEEGEELGTPRAGKIFVEEVCSVCKGGARLEGWTDMSEERSAEGADIAYICIRQ